MNETIIVEMVIEEVMVVVVGAFNLENARLTTSVTTTRLPGYWYTRRGVGECFERTENEM